MKDRNLVDLEQRHLLFLPMPEVVCYFDLQNKQNCCWSVGEGLCCRC
ncbi:hypothetical protein OIU79_002798 [Salix purpurea]|uniref:Uncharacterized protein n=1 Tax=Salix purpurea TaxID=77065 RepID=A0A9Q0ZEH5_SALPP|nr:hypothetical protein OIU79_002798 [Salix purpurea]